MRRTLLAVSLVATTLCCGGIEAGEQVNPAAIPPEAAKAIEAVKVAAQNSNFEALRNLMLPELADPLGDRDELIAEWKSNTEMYVELYQGALVRSINLGCRFDEKWADRTRVICAHPDRSKDFISVYIKTGSGWKLAYFTAAD